MSELNSLWHWVVGGAATIPHAATIPQHWI